MQYYIRKHFEKSMYWVLELEGFSSQWVLTKEPSDMRVTAIQVKGLSKSELPVGAFESGKIIEWDQGSFRLKEQHEFMYVIDFDGKKLKGSYILVQAAKAQWLFYRKT